MAVESGSCWVEFSFDIYGDTALSRRGNQKKKNSSCNSTACVRVFSGAPTSPGRQDKRGEAFAPEVLELERQAHCSPLCKGAHFQISCLGKRCGHRVRPPHAKIRTLAQYGE